MTRLRARWLVWFMAALFVLPCAQAQTPTAWQACLKAPTRACVFAEAIGRMRDDAPPARDPRFADWDRLLYLRLSEIAAAKKDRALFDEAMRSAGSDPDADGRRSALRWVAAAQARAGFADDAVRTLDDGDDGGFATEEIAIALVRAGRAGEALSAVQRLGSAEARIRALVRSARATKDAQFLERALAALRGLEDGYEQSALRPLLAIAYAELGHVEQALRIAGGTAVSYHRAQALAGIAALTRNPRLLSEARSFAVGFDGRGNDDEVWAALARAEIALDVLQGARATLAAHVPNAPSRALAAAAGELAAAHWLNGDKQTAEKLIDELLGGSWTIGEARAVLARRLIASGRFDEARQVSFLADEITFDNLSAEIALKQAEGRRFTEALETADKIQHPGRRSPTLAEIAAMMPE